MAWLSALREAIFSRTDAIYRRWMLTLSARSYQCRRASRKRVIFIITLTGDGAVMRVMVRLLVSVIGRRRELPRRVVAWRVDTFLNTAVTAVAPRGVWRGLSSVTIVTRVCYYVGVYHVTMVGHYLQQVIVMLRRHEDTRVCRRMAMVAMKGVRFGSLLPTFVGIRRCWMMRAS